MRGQGKGLPDAMNRCTAEAGTLGHGPCRPVRSIGRCGLQSKSQYAPHILLAELVRGARTGLVHQSVQSHVQIALPPLAYRLKRYPQPMRNGRVAVAIGSQKNTRDRIASACGVLGLLLQASN